MQPDPTVANPAPKMPLVAFDPSEAHIAAYTAEIAPIVAEALAFAAGEVPDLAPEAMTRIKTTRRELVRMRNQIDRGRLAMNAEALAWQRSINSKAKSLMSSLAAPEATLNAAVEKVENAEREAAEAIVRYQEAREAAAMKKLNDEVAALKAEERRREEDERAAERKKLADERAAFEREQAEKRAAQAEIDRVHAEEQARIAANRADEDRIRAQQKAALDAQIAKVREEQAALDRAKFEKEAQERAEKELTERVERMAALAKRVEADRVERERLEIGARAEREAAEKRAEEEARPDVEKIRAFGDWLEAEVVAGFHRLPNEWKTDATTRFIKELNQNLYALAVRCKTFGKRPTKGGA